MFRGIALPLNASTTPMLLPKLLLTWLVLVAAIHCNGQQLKLYGQLKDSLTNEPLPYAHLLLKQLGRGSITDEEGFFEITLPMQGQDTLAITYVGYKTLYRPLTALRALNGSSVVFYLQPEEALLTELVVRPGEDPLVELLQEAAVKAPANYGRQTYLAKGFYRHTLQQGNSYARLVEAAISLQDRGYHINEYWGLKVRVDAIRRSEDNITYSWRTALNKWLSERNTIYYLLKMSPIRKKDKASIWVESATDYRPYKTMAAASMAPVIKEGQGQFQFLNSKEISEGCVVTLDTAYLWEGDTIYKIDFTPIETQLKKSYTCGTAYINTTDVAVVEYEIRLMRGAMPDDMTLMQHVQEGDTLARYHFKYGKVHKKYRLLYATMRSIGDGDRIFRRDWRKGQKGLVYAEQQLLFTSWGKGPMKYRDVLARDEDIYDVSLDYDAAFWAQYTILPDFKLKERIKADLERKEGKLANQFKDN